MGFVRFALAIIVLISHAGYQQASIGALGSVEAFFILSGTYMCAVWSTRYRALPARVFFVNRILRLWPTYLALLVFTFLVYLGWGGNSNDNHLFDLFQAVDSQGWAATNALMVFISVTLIGQDIISVSEPAHFMLPVRQSWSIATELLFYLTVPLVFTRARIVGLLTCFAALMACKYLLIENFGWRHAYFLPAGNWGYFLLGGALYFISKNRSIWPALDMQQFKYPVLLLLLLVLFGYGEASFERAGPFRHFLFVAAFSLLVVLLFEKSISRTDIFLGNLSYGIYLNHFAVLCIGSFIGLRAESLLVFTLLFSVMLAFAVERYIQRPIDRRRSSYWQQSARLTAS